MLNEYKLSVKYISFTFSFVLGFVGHEGTNWIQESVLLSIVGFVKEGILENGENDYKNLFLNFYT